jgi:hypothetical protein
MNEERREVAPSEHVTSDDLRAILNAAPIDRQSILIRLVEAAYQRGWSDCEVQWTAYTDLLEKPTATA